MINNSSGEAFSGSKSLDDPTNLSEWGSRDELKQLSEGQKSRSSLKHSQPNQETAKAAIAT